MVEEFRQFDECKLTLSIGRSELEDLPAEGLAERVSVEELDLEISGAIRIVQQPLPSEVIQVAYVESEEWPKPK